MKPDTADLQPPVAPAAAQLRIFLADDHPVVLSGMKALVANDSSLELVGEATDGPTALRRAIELKPDVAVLDLSMPILNGIEVSRKLLAACPDCRVLVLTVHEDGAYLRQVLELGVSGYVLKRSAAEELIRGIHAVASGGLYLDPAIAGRAIGRAAPHPPGPSESTAVADLSTREIEVLRLAAIGHSNKSIAAKLQIGAKSVETYKARGMAKLGFHNRVEVVRFALSMGWLDDPA
jgi:DNA-binding NarL/FixJ family response regulator